MHHHLAAITLALFCSTSAFSQTGAVARDNWMVVLKGGHMLIAEKAEAEADLTRHVYVVDFGEEAMPSGIPPSFRHVEVWADGRCLCAVPQGGEQVWRFTVAQQHEAACPGGDQGAMVVGISNYSAENGWDTTQWLSSTEDAQALLLSTRR